MKKVCIIFLLSIIISLTALGFSGVLGAKTQNGHTMSVMNAQNAYLRIHIRADSNEESAQAVKYRVRDKVVEYLTPLVAEYQTKTEALQGVATHLDEIAEIASKALKEEGFSYGASAELTKETFPTRVYGDFTLPSGEYSALILRLGSGKGDNWWCVVYPPLCFAAPTGQNVIYKSKIKEIIENFQKE
ncbi:MAG: stage II sporulation protein R [Clostridia bacterium]|nr:stage II sporulation protein R [Clostridia bacterium]